MLLAEQEPGQALGLQALGLAAADDQQGALAALAEALALAGPESYIPVFVDEGVP